MSSKSIDQQHLSPPVPSKLHTIVLVAGQAPSYADQTRSNVTLPASSIFAYLHQLEGCMKICPTNNLPSEVDDVFLGHDGQPNIVLKPLLNIIEVDHQGIKRGEILKCRCTANSVVQYENNIKGLTEDKICDHKDLIYGKEHQRLHGCDDTGTNNKDNESIEHVEDGGGVLVGV